MSLIGAAAIGAGASLLGGIISGISTHQNNKFNQNMASLSRSDQLRQQGFANQAYIDERDYSRALQQTMMDREDTSIQRSVQDATAAGFSPLAALGNVAGAGPVVSSPSAPGNMVSNAQASTQSIGDLGFTSAGGMIMTALEQKSQHDHQQLMQDLQLAGALKQQGAQHAHEKLMQQISEGAQIRSEERQFNRDLLVIANNQEFLRTMAADAQQHDKDMAADARQHDKDMAQFDIDTASQQESALARLASNSSPEVIVDLLRRVDSKITDRVADFIEDNPEYSFMVADLIRSIEELPVTINNYAAAASPVEGTTAPISRSGRASSGGAWNPSHSYYYSPSDLGY